MPVIVHSNKLPENLVILVKPISSSSSSLSRSSFSPTLPKYSPSTRDRHSGVNRALSPPRVLSRLHPSRCSSCKRITLWLTILQRHQQQPFDVRPGDACACPASTIRRCGQHANHLFLFIRLTGIRPKLLGYLRFCRNKEVVRLSIAFFLHISAFIIAYNSQTVACTRGLNSKCSRR